MTVKCTPASITVEVPTDAVTLDAETVSALLDGSADRTTLARVRDLITPRTVTIPEGTRVRLKVNPGGYPGFLCSMRGWDNDDVTVAHVTNTEVLIRSALAQDYTLYAGPFEKILDVLEVLEDKSPDRAELAQEPVAWVPIHPRTGPLWSMTTGSPDPERLPHYPLKPLYASSAPAAAPERAADLGENIIGAQRAQVRTLTAERDELAARLAQIAAQPPERPLYPFNVPLGERSLRRVHCRLNPELLDGLDHFEDERWKRIAENAQAVTTGGEDKGDYFEVPAHLMAALALALDEWPGAQGQAGAASMGTKIRPAAAPDRAELAQAREVLSDCATTLESYARHHAERGPEHAHKVTRNAELAARCRAALAAKE